MKELIYLLKNSERNVQLYRYLTDAQKELSKQRSNSAGPQYYICGMFFSRAFGLDFGYRQAVDLAKAIREGKFKPDSKVEENFIELSGSLETHWNRLVSEKQ